MFWNRKSANGDSKKEKLSGPQPIPNYVQKYLVAEKKIDPGLAQLLKAVVVRTSNGGKAYQIRIFDGSEAAARKFPVKNYTSLDEHPEMIIYEGQYEEGVRQISLNEMKKVFWDTPILTEEEIRQKIEALSEPGASVFFYMARGSANGGPLGMGAAVVELNPNYPGKKQKKYVVYPTDVVDLDPVGKGVKLFDSDKVKEIARWIKDGHHKREY